MDIAGPLSNGIITGAIISVVSYGAVFFMLIKIGMQYGFRKGALFEIGHILSLVLIVSVINLSLLQVNQILIFKVIFSLIGGIALLIFGVNTFKNAGKAADKKMEISIPNHRFILSGFLLNLLNPFEFIVWLGIVGSIHINYQYTQGETTIYCIAALISLAAIDLSKVFLAKKIAKYLTPSVLIRINKVVSIIIFSIGLFLIVYFFVLLQKLI